MRGIRKAFGATVAVDGVDVSVLPGEVCAIVGQNGAGKSTLMAILSGALQPDAGQMTLDGAPYQPSHPLDARRAGVAMIYQELSLAPHLIVAENILLGMEPARFGLIRRAEMRRTATDVLARLGHPEIPIDAAVGTLSPAAQQLVEIGRALAVGCRVLVLDEPTSSLSRSRHRAAVRAHRRVEAHGPRDRLHLPLHRRSERGCRPDRRLARRQSGGRRDDGRTRASRHRGAHGRPAGGRTLSAVASPTRRGDSRRCRIRPVERDIHAAPRRDPRDCRAARRRTHPAGARAVRPRAGAHAGGCASARGPATAAPHERWRMGCGFLSEDRKEEGLAAALSIADNMTLTRLEGLGPGPMVFPRAQDRAATRWMERLHIKSARSAPARRRALGRQPAKGRDRTAAPSRRRRPAPRRAHARHRRRQQGADLRAHRCAGCRAPGNRREPRAVLMVSSYIPELLGLCDRVAVMCRGRLGEPRPVADLTEHGLMLEATGAGDA